MTGENKQRGSVIQCIPLKVQTIPRGLKSKPVTFMLNISIMRKWYVFGLQYL